MNRTDRAPVDAVDARIAAAVRMRDAICIRMAKGEELLTELLTVTAEVSQAKFERDRIIRQHFNGGAR